MPKVNASYKCLSSILLASVIKASKKYYPQILLEECEYEIKKAKIEKFIDVDLEKSSSVDETDSETEYDNVNNFVMNFRIKLVFLQH